MQARPSSVSQLSCHSRLRRMMITIPATSRATISHGTQRFGIVISAGTGGVYRDEACTPSRFSLGFTALGSPGRVPLGVVRPPPVLRLGGATAEQSTVARVRRVLVIDSYDSFVYNLVQYLGELGAEPVVHRNDAKIGRGSCRER